MSRREPAPRHRVGRSKKTLIPRGEVCERTGKQSFLSERDAVKAAARIKSNNPHKRRKAMPVHVYQCDACGAFHLSRQPQRKEVGSKQA